ncbi:MAG: type II toxin-antitoxin system HipA family toxin [Actinomycetota bacterium]|nr:type II toxin-antitoxin system HipA family toxin [Actinomycetota bacterium]
MTTAAVNLWGTRIGAVTSDEDGGAARFQYSPGFVESHIEVAPLTMALRRAEYSFPGLSADSFHGLPGLLADSLPDKYGEALINAWLASQGRTPGSFTPVERLCYVGKRGMGALEYEPVEGPDAEEDHQLDVAALVELASEALADREKFVANFEKASRRQAMRDILRVGTSAGGARAKALIAYNPDTGEVRSGQLNLGPGFEHWLLKLDGVAENRDREALADPQGYGTIEYAYWLMAGDFGIGMTECRLFPEGGRRHFMTRRFDRDEYGKRKHVQTLAAIAHLDYRQAAVHSYEEAFGVMSRLGLTAEEFEQQYRRMVFNVVARNQDDHTKNVSFIMDRGGRFSLSPAYDVTHAYAPSGDWTARHQMSVNGKRDDFSVEDFIAAGKTAKLPRRRAQAILREATDVVSQWPAYAERANVPEKLADAVAGDLRLTFRRD